MLSKRYESTEINRRTWLHVPSGTHWSTSSDTQQAVEIQIETSTKMYTITDFNSTLLCFSENSSKLCCIDITFSKMCRTFKRHLST